MVPCRINTLDGRIVPCDTGLMDVIVNSEGGQVTHEANKQKRKRKKLCCTKEKL